MLPSLKKKRGTNVLRCHRLKLQTQVPRLHMSLLSSHFVLLNATIKKQFPHWETSWQGAPQVATSSNCRATTAQRSQSLMCILRRFLRKPSRSFNFTPRSLFSSSAGCEILNEAVRTEATRVRLADRAGSPAITCWGRSSGVKGGVEGEERGGGGWLLSKSAGF